MTTGPQGNGIPDKIGKYEVKKILGRGSMGVVYLARDPFIDRDVAIKTILLPEGLEDYKIQEFRERFLREARAAGRLNHPSIVTIYEADDGSAGAPPFIAMEFVEGLPWNYKIRQKIMPEADAVLPLIRDIASALDYAHKTGVVHRDIKPANIVQTPEGKVKLMDFGIAKVPTSELTREGQFLGTPAYMSPEQIQGKKVDGRSDLFSLGTVLYELLTCKKPFPGDDITTVTYRIIKEPPAPPRGMNPDLPPQVEQILNHLLAKEPDERYVSAHELVEDIDAYLGGAALPHAGTAAAGPAPRPEPATRKAPPPPPAPPKERPKAQAGAPPQPPAPKAGKPPGKKLSSTALLLGGMGALLVVALGILTAAYFWFRSARASQAGQPETPAVESPADQESLAPSTVQPETLPANEPAVAPEPEPPKPAKPRVRAPRVPPKATPSEPSPGSAGAASAESQPKPAPPPPPPPAHVTYSFNSHILKGEFWIRVDGKEVAHQVIKRKFTFKSETFSGSFDVPPGEHQVSFEIKTDVQNITGKHVEKLTFQPDQKRSLKIEMTKLNKELSFEWGG